MNEYQTVYIYQPSGIEIGHYFFFLMMVLLGFGIALLIKKTFKTYSLPRQTAIFFFGFIVGGTSIIFLIVYENILTPFNNNIAVVYPQLYTNYSIINTTQ